MIAKNYLIFILCVAPATVLAAGKSTANSDYIFWALFAFVVVLVTLGRNRINESIKNTAQLKQATQVAKPATAPVTKVQVQPDIKKAEAKPVPKQQINFKQCQAITAKGSQCKRITNLKSIVITIKGIERDLTVCNQHNNKAAKPYDKST